MIQLKDAISKAMEHVRDVYSAFASDSLRVEEVRRGEDDRYWYITLSFRRSLDPLEMSQLKDEVRWYLSSSDLSSSEIIDTVLRSLRDSKVIQIDAKTGQAVSMTNRAA